MHPLFMKYFRPSGFFITGVQSECAMVKIPKRKYTPWGGPPLDFIFNVLLLYTETNYQ